MTTKDEDRYASTEYFEKLPGKNRFWTAEKEMI